MKNSVSLKYFKKNNNKTNSGFGYFKESFPHYKVKSNEKLLNSRDCVFILNKNPKNRNISYFPSFPSFKSSFNILQLNNEEIQIHNNDDDEININKKIKLKNIENMLDLCNIDELNKFIVKRKNNEKYDIEKNSFGKKEFFINDNGKNKRKIEYHEFLKKLNKKKLFKLSDLKRSYSEKKNLR